MLSQRVYAIYLEQPIGKNVAADGEVNFLLHLVEKIQNIFSNKTNNGINTFVVYFFFTLKDNKHKMDVQITP